MRIGDWSSDVCSSDLPSFDLPTLLHDLSVLALPVLTAITFHEAAHGYVAWKRPEERRVGQECVRPCRSRWTPNYEKTKTINTIHINSRLSQQPCSNHNTSNLSNQ